MADLLVGGVSQSFLLQLQPKLGSFQRLQLFNKNGYPRFAVVGNPQLHLKGVAVSGVVSSDSKAPTIVTNANTVDFAKGGTEVEVDTGNGGGDKFDDRSGGGGGGGGGDNSGGGGDSGNKGEEEFSDDGSKRKMPLSMSQKLTLGYAALVGVGGVMGYMKSGSQKSLLAGGFSAAVLYYVYTQLPTNPVFASSLGLGKLLFRCDTFILYVFVARDG
ncbi:hypothetical protein PTKIN_Ptkin03bG0217600 [Pterospermum kingtungense]